MQAAIRNGSELNYFPFQTLDSSYAFNKANMAATMCGAERARRVSFCEIKSKCVSCGLETRKRKAATVNENLSGRQPRSAGFIHGLDKCFVLRLARLV